MRASWLGVLFLPLTEKMEKRGRKLTLEIGILAKEKLIELVIQEGVLKAEDGRHLFQLSYQELDLIYKGMKNITA